MLRIRVEDRHAEHADGREELCDHRHIDMRVGDGASCNIYSGAVVIATLHVKYASKENIEIVVDHFEYLLAKRMLEEPPEDHAAIKLKVIGDVLQGG
jgi:hypothetical protein